MRKLALAFAAIAAFLFATPAIAATLIVDGSGQLTGATGVLINGVLYDVTFADGTCAALFNGCDSTSDFTFTNPVDASNAAAELLNQVFLDGSQGQFDSNPSLTAGCEIFVTFNVCKAVIPHTFVSPTLINAVGALNTTTGDSVTIDDTVTQTGDTSQSALSVFAIFTLHVSSGVPEPSTWEMMLLGFAGIGFALRRRATEAPARFA
jgi:hypothetical protein